MSSSSARRAWHPLGERPASKAHYELEALSFWAVETGCWILGRLSQIALPEVAVELLCLVRDTLDWTDVRDFVDSLPEGARRARTSGLAVGQRSVESSSARRSRSSPTAW